MSLIERAARPGSAGEHWVGTPVTTAATNGAGVAVEDLPPTDLGLCPWATVDELVTAVADVDRAISAMTAWRMRLIDQARRLGEAVHHATLTEISSTQDIPRRTMVAELACALRVSERAMGASADMAQVLVEGFPTTLAAMGRGEITSRHADVVVGAAQDLEGTARATAETHLLELAGRMNVPRFRSAAHRWRERHHPRNLAERHEEATAGRCVVLDPAPDGMAWLSAHLPAPQAWAIHDRVSAIAASMRGDTEERSLAHLRADVLADLLLAHGAPRSETPASGPVSHAIRPTVMVTVPVMTLLGHGQEPGHLEGYGPIDPITARELAAEAPSFLRILTHPESGTVLSVGRTRYAVPSDMRRFLRLRDETCRFPGCGRRAGHCDVDHSRAWEDGGATECQNLAHLCRHHHRLKHHGGWRLAQEADGMLRWTSPTGRLHVTEPALLIGRPPDVGRMVRPDEPGTHDDPRAPDDPGAPDDQRRPRHRAPAHDESPP